MDFSNVWTWIFLASVLIVVISAFCFLMVLTGPIEEENNES